MQPPSREALARLADELERGFSLPASWYTDPAVATLERERVFRRAWQYVGRAEQLARVGDCITAEVADVPVVVVRGEQGLRGLVNVCRHRQHLVVSGAGNHQALRCPYHGWCYDLDGNLRSAPRAERECGFDLAALSLLPVQVDTWGPFVFANLEAAALPLAHYLGALPAAVARNGLALDRLKFLRREEWRVAANWKVLIDNFLECYHCPLAHPGFSSVVDVSPGAYALETFEWSSGQSAPARGGPGAAYDARGEVKAQYYHLWPNFSLSTHPGHLNLILHVWLPDGPDATRGFTERYFGPDVPERFAEEVTAFSRQVGVEDRALCASVQQGLRGGLPERGRLLGESERLVAHFQRLYLRALSGGG
jgi:choline monooxygenase